MKVAVSIPDSIFEAAEKLAKKRDIPRSQLFAEALAAYLELRNSESVTALLDEIYSHHSSAVDKGLSKAQFESVSHEAW
ncbi:MAG: metal-responsive CopG/Arc/MetJ family transcriptional regulator [Planctomycetaceae bacterium]|jgi:metal-responsive CopG/Arc/MetJ family transcriptional regulator